MKDNLGRAYARLSELRPGQLVQVDDGFEGCFPPWSTLPVVEGADGELALPHNDPECGACEGSNEDGPCLHYLAGQLADDNDSLIGIYLTKEPTP